VRLFIGVWPRARKIFVNEHREYRFDDFHVKPGAWNLYRDGEVIHLEPTVLKLLVFLIANRDRLVTREELMDTVWGNTVVSESALSKAVARLRKALDDDPRAPRYIETVHSKGYRFVAEVEETDPDTAVPATLPAFGRYLVMAVVLAGLLLALVLLFGRDEIDKGAEQTAGQGPDQIESLAVLPLDNLAGTSDKDYFVEGLHEVLITELSKISGLRVISRQSTMRFGGSEWSLPAIAGELGVDALVEGSALLVGERVQVTAQLINGSTDEHIWAQTYERDARDVLGLLSEVAATISAEIESNLRKPAAQRPATVGPVDPVASDAYLRGLYHLNRFSLQSFKKARVHFEEAIAVEPGFALAWGGLAGTNLMLAYYGQESPREAILQARVAALEALKLDEQSFSGHAAMGWVRLFTWDWPGAGQSFEEALRLNPNDSMTLHGYADYLMLTGRPEDGLAQIRHARLIDPFSPISNMPVPFHLYMMRRYDEAIADIAQMQERIPGNAMHQLLALIYWQQGHMEEALEQERQALVQRKDFELLAALEQGEARGGPQAAMLAMAETMISRSATTYVDPYTIAVTFARAGQPGETLDWLEAAVERGSLELMYVRFRPEFDPLRDDPRFVELVQRLGLPGE
jgi:TolB-like protein/DNA-binding winged helix-turn-helix (wHTH) protein